MNFEFSSLTDSGLVRDNNEDSVAFDAKVGLAVLADGMGGYNAGEIASAMAVTFVRTELSQWLRDSDGRTTSQNVQRALELCVVHANQAIYNSALSNAQFTGMGTTLVVGVFEPERVTLGHVGDSRCYLWRNRQLTQLTRDHSLLQEQLEAGLITQEQAKVATHKNLVTRALGVDGHVAVDVQEHTPLPGDIYLMCSDGLTDMIDDEHIARLLADDAGLASKSRSLVQAANSAGGRDNISVVLVQVKAKSGAQGFFSRIMRAS